jgi:hypothetical protein
MVSGMCAIILDLGRAAEEPARRFLPGAEGLEVVGRVLARGEDRQSSARNPRADVERQLHVQGIVHAAAVLITRNTFVISQAARRPPPRRGR